ncbi:MAG: tRNA1(Val) (adenine(37)-N6)-methyltransferase [Alphaproteobacteria bacterium]
MSDRKNLIHVLNKRVALYQAPQGFRTSMDSVMLAASCPAKPNESILDLGCGVGSAGICVLQRVPKTDLTGVEIQKDHIELSIKNADENGFGSRANFICDDVKKLEIETFNHVICNPPYMEAGAHLNSPSPSKAKAMGYINENDTLQDWVTCAHKHIKGQGSLSIIHDAGHVDSIIHALYGKSGGKRFGAIEIIPIFSRKDTPAKRVIIRAYKHKKSNASILSGIVMHKDDGSYTNDADEILRHAKPLF